MDPKTSTKTAISSDRRSFGLKAIVYLWAGPNTAFGVVVGWMLGGSFCVEQGVIEIHGPRVAAVLNRLWLPALAITLGHCVLGQTEAGLESTRVHERVHVRQYERWGPFFIPAYLAAWAVLCCLGRDGYRENPFEIEAYKSGDS
jgi:hypothetical protein